MEAAVQWSKIPTLEEKYNSTKLDVKIKSPTVVCLLLIFSQIWLTSVSQTIWRSISKGIRQIESLSDEPQLSSENWPVLDLILRVGDGWRVPDELEPGGRVGLQLQEVRGRGGSWKYFKIFQFLLGSQSQHDCPGKYPELFPNIWKFNKNPQKFEFDYFYFFQSVFVFTNLGYWLHSRQTRIYWGSVLRRVRRFHSRFWRQQRNCIFLLSPNHWSLWRAQWNWETENKNNLLVKLLISPD